MNQGIESFQAKVLVRSHDAIAPIYPEPSQKGDFIYLTKRLSPHGYDTIRSSRGIVSEEGGSGDHASVMCRILGKPLLRLDNATSILQTGEVYKIGGQSGQIEVSTPELIGTETPLPQVFDLARIIDEKKPQMQVSIVGEDEVRRVNGEDLGGVDKFFLRAELIWASKGLDPFEYVAANGIEKSANILADHLQGCVAQLKPDQAINFRSVDWRPAYPDEGNSHHTAEPNPELGLHGIRRLLVKPDMLIAEMRAIQMVDSDQVIFSLPFITTSDELEAVKQIAADNGMSDVRLGIFVETAAAVSEIDEFIDQGVDLISIGTKDLTQMILACDRNNTHVQHLYDPTKRPVIRAVNRVLEAGLQTNTPVVVFSILEDLRRTMDLCPDMSGISICAGEYMQIADSTKKLAAN